MYMRNSHEILKKTAVHPFAEWKTNKQTNKQTNKHTNKQTNKQTNNLKNSAIMKLLIQGNIFND